MKVSNIITERYDSVSIHKMALQIHSMAEESWEDQHDEYPSNEQTIEAIKGILSQLHIELKEVIKEYNHE